MNVDEVNKLTHKIIGCAMEVHNQLGNGFQEVIYQRSLAIEFGLQGLSFQRELEMELFYKGEQVGTRRVDFFVEGAVMVEIKAIEKLEGVYINRKPSIIAKHTILPMVYSSILVRND